MKNYKITVEYDGTRYNGWQRQGNTQNTIQARFESVLSEMCQRKIEVFASGRTDAGVHARGQVANFQCETDKSCEEIRQYLNRYLPQDIRVLTIEEADARFHSRLHAVSKTYEYRIATQKPDVFMRKYVYALDAEPDIETMRNAAKLFLGKHDFKGFSSVGKTKKSTIREIQEINVQQEEELIKIRIRGNGFLYNQVRIMAGTLLAVGMGELSASVIEEVFEERVREKAGKTLPAQGLTLMEVFYE